MRDDLSPAFLAELEKNSRAPRQLVEFHFSTGVWYLSDQPVGLVDGLARDYNPIISSWGQLRDNVRVEPIVEGQSLEVRQLSMTIINMGEPRFSSLFKDEDPENVKVYLYQWFDGLDPADMALIDIFVCQDPIVISEASSLVKIDLVSPIMASNNFIWGPNKTIDVRYPMLIGKEQVIAQSMETGPTAILLYDIDQDFLGEVFIENSLGDWSEDLPYKVFIDSEQVTIDSMHPSKMNITARARNGTVARPHIRGALICDPTAQYDYSLTAGPVSTIDNLLGDGETYNNPYTVFPGENPTFIRFDGRPPWHKVEAGEPGEPIIPNPEETTQYGASSEVYSEVVGNPSNPANINNTGSNAIMSFDHSIGGQELTQEYGTIYNTFPSSWKQIGYFNPDTSTQSTISSRVGTFPYDDSDYLQWPTGEEAYQEITFGENWNHLGTLVKVEVRENGAKFESDGFTMDCYVYWNNGNVLESARLTNTNFPGNIQTYSPSGDWFTLDGITSWTNLANLRVGVKGISVQRNNTNAYVNILLSNVEFRITYQPPVQATYPLQEVVSHFNRDLSSLGAFVSAEIVVRFDCASINCDLTQSIVARTDNDPNNNSTMWSRNITSTQAMAGVKVYPSISSMAHLKAMRIGLRHRCNGPAGPGDRRIATTNVAYVEWRITYQPGAIDQPDEERVIYVTELMADVTSQAGENVTPAKAIQNLLTQVGDMGEYIDEANFVEMDGHYAAAGYYFNGLIDGETRFHDALKDLLRQGTTRILYNAGLIKLISNFVKELTPVAISEEDLDYAKTHGRVQVINNQETIFFYKDDIRRRSVTEERMRFQDVINKITLRYKPNTKRDEWEGEIVVEDQDSIAQIGQQETSLDYPYIQSESIAQVVADRMLEMRGVPRAFTTFRVYAPAFPVEKADQLFFETNFNDYFGMTGPVMTANRVFGSGKTGIMNIWEITIMSFPIIAHILDIFDTINIADSMTRELALSIDVLIQDQISVAEVFSTEQINTLFLDVSETINISESVNLLKGVNKYLNISEAVNISSGQISFESVLPIYKVLSDPIQIQDALRHDINKDWSLNIYEEIRVQDLSGGLDLSGGYGDAGYGEGGYGGSADYFFVTFQLDNVTFGGDDVTHPK